MSTERTPEEIEANEAARTAVEAVLEQAHRDLTSWNVAEALDESPTVCEAWLDRLWNGLRDNLSAEQRLEAIVLLLEPRAIAEANQILDKVGEPS
jgi:hypothetical protein